LSEVQHIRHSVHAREATEHCHTTR
jgi:hypothetical protein